MILQALKELAEREGLVDDPDFQMVPVAWIVTVNDAGHIISITDTKTTPAATGKKKPRPVAPAFRIPRQQSSRSGTKAPPAFLVDNAKYVFGRPTVDKPFTEEEGRQKSGWFRDEVAACVDATGDEGAAAVLRALDDVAAGRQTVTLDPTLASNELFAFVYEPDVDVMVHRRPAVKQYWQERRRQSAVVDTDARLTCMVTGVPIGVAGTFPKIKNVPGGQSAGSSLISFNTPAFESFGLRGNENAPISREVAEASATALQRLLHPAFPDPRPDRAGWTLPRRNVALGADTAVCYWASSAAGDALANALAGVFDADPAVVGDAYRSAWRGRPIAIDDDGQFYALVVSGAQGRMVIRDWFEATVGQVSRHLAEHFADLAVVRNTPAPKDRPLPDAIPLRAMLASLAPFGKQDLIPPALASQIFHAAIAGTPYPLSVLQRAVERTRAEIGRTDWPDLERRDARAALIKGVLTRRRCTFTHVSYPEPTVSLDPTNTSPGYLCGRLMAVIERLQQAALGDVNASVVDRFFGAASATPRAVFTRLLRNARHHARKAKDEPKTSGTARWLERMIDEISVPFDVKHNGFPAFLDLEQQGLFVLGYHQQRHALWAKRTDSAPAEPSAVVTA